MTKHHVISTSDIVVSFSDHSNIKRFLRGGGKHGRGKAIDLVSLGTPAYKFRAAFDEIKYFNQWLAKFIAYNYQKLMDPEVKLTHSSIACIYLNT
jgi:hypothetical protein